MPGRGAEPGHCTSGLPGGRKMKIICLHHVVALWQKGESWGTIEARSDRWRRKLPRHDYVLRSVFLLSRGHLQCDLDDAQPLAMVDIRERYAGLWRGIQDGVIERRFRARPRRQHKSERAISLARPRPLYSDFQRFGSGSRSQRLLPRNHSAPASPNPRIPHFSTITLAARSF
jgi:hypothetical protein